MKRTGLILTALLLLMTGCGRTGMTGDEPACITVEIPASSILYATVSPTAEPTAAPSPSPTPVSTVPPLPMISINLLNGYVNANGVNFRSAASLDSDIICTLDLGSSVIITGEGEEWFRVVFGRTEGYIAKRFIAEGEYVPPTPAPTPRQESAYYSVSPGRFTEDEIYLVARFITCEARYGTEQGQRAVASVVLNRVMNGSGSFPNTVRGVLLQHNQFVPEGRLLSTTPTQKALRSARYVFAEHGSILPKKVLFYKAAYLGTTWESYMTYYATIDGNCFFYGKIYF